MGNNTVKASALYLLGNICTKAIAFLTIPIFTRLLSTADYGIVNTYSSWVHIASVVVTLSLYNSFRMAYVEKKAIFDSYCASILRLGFLLYLTSVLIAVGILMLAATLREYWWMIFSCLTQAYGMFCVTAMSTKYMLEFAYNKRSFYMIVPNLACAVLAIFLLVTHDENRAMWRILSYLIVYIAFALLALFETRKGKTNTSFWKYAVSYSLPLVFHGLSLVILSSSDRIMITSLVGAAESGIYSLVYNFGLIATAITSSLEGVWVPWFIRKLKDDKIKDINCNAKYLIENVTIVVIGVMLVAPEVIKVMASEEYWAGIPMIFPIVVVSYIMFLYDLAVNVEYQFKATKKIATNTVISAAINIVLNAMLIPVFGAIAAAYTTVVAYAFSLMLHYYNARKCCASIFPAQKYIGYILVVISFSVVSKFIINLVFLRWCIACILAIVYSYLMFVKKRFIALRIKM